MDEYEEGEDFTEEQREWHREMARAWFDRMVSAPGRLCPVCGVDDWRVWDMVNLPIGRGHPSERIYFVIPIVCGNCGYVRQFGARTMGLVPPDEDDEEEGT